MPSRTRRLSFPPLRSWSAALIATVIGFGGTIALVVQALRNLGATVEQTGSAVTALCLGIGLAGALLSVGSRIPVVLAWSTPGAALLAATTPGVSWVVAVGAFVVAGVLMVVLGLVPALGRLADRIPAAIAAGMLAGVLLPFCLTLFRLGGTDPLLVGVLLGVFVVARQRVPLHALLLVLACGVVITVLRGQAGAPPPGAVVGRLLPAVPVFDPASVASLALPLFLVTLVSQNLPGLAVLRAAGYAPASGRLIAGTGVATTLLAPFGAFGVNLAAITAAICTGEDAHPDRAKRWQVALLYAGFYLLLALFSPALVRLFLALPAAVIAVLTGLALIPALTGAAMSMLATAEDREPAILTFLATGSGVVLFGLGSAFWGLVAGLVALVAVRLKSRRA